MPIELSKLTADPGLAQEGKWFEFGDPADGVAFRIAFMETKAFANKRDKMLYDARKRNRNRELTQENQSNIVNEVMAGTVLLEWRGILLNGMEFPFSRDNAKKVLSEYINIRDFVVTEASNLENFQLPTGDLSEPEEDQPQAQLKSSTALDTGEQSQAGGS